MTTKLKFTGRAHERSFVKGDFTKHSVDDGHAVKFNVDNNFVAEVSDGMAEWLLANEGAEFHEATEEDEKEQDLTRVGTPARAMAGKGRAVTDDGDDDDSIGNVSLGAVEDSSGTAGRSGRGSTGRGRS